jgi:hypothetical protein
MGIFNNPLFKVSLFSSIYLIILILVSPYIDHIFTSLDEDIKVRESNFQILGEILLHIIVIAIFWYLINNYVPQYIEKIFNITMKDATKSGIAVVSSIALIGLQKNLIDKLEYITIRHPFRLQDLYR